MNREWWAYFAIGVGLALVTGAIVMFMWVNTVPLRAEPSPGPARTAAGR